MKGSRQPRYGTIDGVRPGTFLKTKLHTPGPSGQLTFWVEGCDQDGPSVAGLALNATAVDHLIQRLTNLRKNFQ